MRQQSLGVCCLLVLASFSYSVIAEECGNTGGDNCKTLTDYSQCTEAVVKTCCSKCVELAGCPNIGTSCFKHYVSRQCYQAVIRDNCCLMCKGFQKPHLGNKCLYGDMDPGCVVKRCNEAQYAERCCGTCYTGTTPSGSDMTVAPATESTCQDEFTNCQLTVPATPSSCYNVGILTKCCRTCQNFKNKRQQENYDVNMCPYGDKSQVCVENGFDKATCTSEEKNFTCCDACRPDPPTTAAPVRPTEPRCEDVFNDCEKTVADVPSACYNGGLQTKCCGSCQRYKERRSTQGYNVATCPYGDKAALCVKSDFDKATCSSVENKYYCCDTCGPTITTTPLPTEPPCPDVFTSCAATIEEIPSTCYIAGMAAKCCNSCRTFKAKRRSQNYNVETCPYGDRAAYCIEDNFNKAVCSQVEQSFTCCDTCLASRPTLAPTTAAPTCNDTGAIDCDIAARFCYPNPSSNFYRTACCGTCLKNSKPHLGQDCLYGDKEIGCDKVITKGQECTSDQKKDCCETCQTSMLTTTPEDTCKDTSPSCGGLVANKPLNCYELDDQCCRTCRAHLQAQQPESCRYGDKISFCSADVCDTLSGPCCATCNTPTTTVAATTTEACLDTASNCADGIYMLSDRPDRCYNSAISKVCCATCNRLSVAGTTCRWGDKDPACKRLTNLNCTLHVVASECCAACIEKTSTPAPTTRVPVTAPPGCTDSMNNCDSVTKNLFNCYAGKSFVAKSCCATCFAKRKLELPSDCLFGNKVLFCAVIKNPELLCVNDANFKGDCCKTCYDLQTTTARPTTTAEPQCSNSWRDSTCELLLAQLKGDCSTIRDKCCGTCLPTTAAPVVSTTEGLCKDVFSTCNIIIENEGKDECYTPYMKENCCAYCRNVVTTVAPTITTTRPTLPPGCNGNDWSLTLCKATVSTSPLANPCGDSSVIKDNCCAYCAARTAPPPTAVPCKGDSPSINCESLSKVLNTVCTDEDTAGLCCKFCAIEEMTTTAYPETTTTSCAGNTVVVSTCQAIFDSQGGIKSCELDYMRRRCCLFCASATAPPATTDAPCDGDTSGIDCAALSKSVPDLCNDKDSGPLCCAFCSKDDMTTSPAVPYTVTRAHCTYNKGGDKDCEAAFASQGGIKSCQLLTMLENCCLLCSTATVPPTTKTCTGDSKDLNCTALDLDPSFDGKLCDNSIMRKSSCCYYCDNKPTTVVMTTQVCVDTQPLATCNAVKVACINDPSTQVACCSTCREHLATTVITQAVPTTTVEPGSTVECLDNINYNCSIITDVDPCGSDFLLAQCCAFCRDRPTQAPTTTLPPCYGDVFPDPSCPALNKTQTGFCDNNPSLRDKCCVFCGQEPITTKGEGGAAATVAAVTTKAPTSSGCLKNTYGDFNCQSRLEAHPTTTCNVPLWYESCCKLCDEKVPSGRKRRSVDLLRRERRAVECLTVDERKCQLYLNSSKTTPPSKICIDDFMRELCCGFCTKLNSGVVPEGCTADRWTKESCALVIHEEASTACASEPASTECCLSCAMAGNVTLSPVTTPTPTTPAPRTVAPATTATQPAIECKQSYKAATCEQILQTVDCTDTLIIQKCCDYSCVTTVAPVVTTVPATVTTATVTTNRPPGCGVADNAQTCATYVHAYPSLCYSANVYGDCCTSCTEFYYTRKAEGYNVGKCLYGNRNASCSSSVDCNDEQDANMCCDVCYPRKPVTSRPIIHTKARYVAVVALQLQCQPDFENPESSIYKVTKISITAGLSEMFSFLPGIQDYEVDRLICMGNLTKVIVTMTTSATHTYRELLGIFTESISDNKVGILLIDHSASSFTIAEIYNGQCVKDEATNCHTFAFVPGSMCYHSATSLACCISCNRMAMELYENRTYVPVDCEYGDKDMECNSNIDCSMAEARTRCCHTCAPDAGDYVTPEPPTTTTEFVPTTMEMLTSTVQATVPATTEMPCLGDTSDKCANLTVEMRSCYNEPLVYRVCCKSCKALARWDLPSTCAWGDKESWCAGIAASQCSDPAIYDKCCDMCGPHVTTVLVTQSTTMVTTTAPCLNKLDNCANLTVDASSCYRWANDCCASCRPKMIGYLPETCRFGDKELYCRTVPKTTCTDKYYTEDCCKLCGPEPPTTTTTEPTTVTTLPTTTQKLTTPTTKLTTTTDPGCVADAKQTCGLLTANGGCYSSETETDCCSTCAGLHNASVPNNCRYGDHREYCSTVTRERCLTEARVFTDCCRMCQGLVAPPGVCVDTQSNCDVLAADPSACYADLVYSQCCKTCEAKARDDYGPTCKWGNLKSFCGSYEKSDCDTFDELNQQCCALCNAPPTTSAAPTTAPTPQCADSPTSNCVEDTKEKRFCYDEGVAKDCCASCRLHRTGAPSSCPYGDKNTLCNYLVNRKENCSEKEVRDVCCDLCAPAPTTAMPITTPCADSSVCTAHISSCYNSLYRGTCCATCKAAHNSEAVANCEYGDKKSYCAFINKQQCLDVADVRSHCCVKCPILTRTTTVPPTTTKGITTLPPPCQDKDDSCSTVTAVSCYSPGTRTRCCARCASLDTKVAACPYGDRDLEFCRPSMDCSLRVVRELCCQVCASYVVPQNVEASYKLKINVTSYKCSRLSDKTAQDYLVFKLDLQLALIRLLDTLPGNQRLELTDIDCESVIAILDVKSSGLYEVDVLNKFFMHELSDGRLGTFDVSVYGSSLTALSFAVPLEFEPPACANGDSSLNCLKMHVLAKPSNCAEANIRSQCCGSCSSLFYARLASGVDVTACPYGDRNAECYSLTAADCENIEARARCCDTCASFTTAAPAPTTPKMPTTTTMKPCVDEDSNLCAQGVQNSISFCYESGCCATCSSRKITGMPEDCAWGNKREYCEDYDKSMCSNADVNATCCKLCGDHGIDPTAAPCTGNDDPSFSCSAAVSSPSLCYKPEYQTRCCQTCTKAAMGYLPQGCKWGDRADFCDSTSTICDKYGEYCCASCCPDCKPPTTSTSTVAPTTTVTVASTRPRPDGCMGDNAETNCAEAVKDIKNCYSGAVASLCCESCYNIRRTDLPVKCPYGDKVSTCSAMTWNQCSTPGNDASSICCGTCHSLLDVPCNELAEKEVTNCDQIASGPGTCYSQSVLDRCCKSCKAIAVYTLPPVCRFGDKVTWCGDITEAIKAQMCGIEEYQQECCQTCKDYIGVTAPSTKAASTTIATTKATTMKPATTRLPPNEQCPSGDTAPDCNVKTAGTGACYDPAISGVCCRTCYEQWRGDLTDTCRYGDKSKYCLTTSDADVNLGWCQANAETCCARCVLYLTTTLPTTTLPAACPKGNSLDGCSSRVQKASDCYSPIREAGCCVQCSGFVKPNLPSTCQYGNKADFCQEISADECKEHAQTCCEKCAVHMTTPKPVTKSNIIRVSVQIGRGLFRRSVPPKILYLFQVVLKKSGESCVDDIKDYKTTEFERREDTICTDMGTKMWSLTHCYVEKMDCDADGKLVVYTIMVLVNSSVNYDSAALDANKLKSELLVSQSRRKRATILYFDLAIRDVDECRTPYSLVQDACDVATRAKCTNELGIYRCACITPYEGDGFQCVEKMDPMVGRSNFKRNVPPGDQHLYKIIIIIKSTAGVDHGCFDGMNDNATQVYKDKELKICNALGRSMRSLLACYVDDFYCSNSIPLRVTAYVLIDAAINYPNKHVDMGLLRNDLKKYNGVIESEQVTNVDECSARDVLLKSGCSDNSICADSPGLYSCICNSNSIGNGFTCNSVVTAKPQLSSQGLADWTIALIVVGGVITLVSLVLSIICCCRYNRTKHVEHEHLNSGEETPPKMGGSLPPLYNSLRSTYAPRSEIGSYFYAPQGEALPGYAMKTYNVGASVPPDNDTTTFMFD